MVESSSDAFAIPHLLRIGNHRVCRGGRYPRLMAKRKQKTDKGLEIPVPSKGDFDAAMRKVAPPARRKRPDEKDPPQKQSG
jgi:hypothetical protein